MLTYDISLKFVTPYCAHPYWPEMYEVIEITKKSGINRAKSEANRRKALEEYLRLINMTLDDFRELEKRSQRPFHTRKDGEIIIPMEKFMAFLVNANHQARAAFRACPPDQVWSRIQCTDLRTGKTEKDATEWKRPVPVKLGTGALASNQRALRQNTVLDDFTATGRISFDEKTVDPESLENLIKWGGEFVGIGASRKMGRGRFGLAAWALRSQAPSELEMLEAAE